MGHADENKDVIIAEVARLYYIEGLSQAQIAKSLFLSKPTVSRALKLARERKIVEFTINYPLERSLVLEEALKRRFGLEEALVALDLEGYENVEVSLKQIGAMAADWLNRSVVDGDRLGVSWGKTVDQVARHLKPGTSRSVKVFQVVGSPNEDYSTSGRISSIAQNVAEAFGGSCSLLYSPMYIENDAVRRDFMKEPIIRRSLERIRTVDYLLTGIADLCGESSSCTWAGYLTEERRSGLLKKGAVGYICGYFIDANGAMIDDELNRRIIGIRFADLCHVPHVLAVAGGFDKTRAIHAALSGNLVDVLVTDSRIAEKLVAFDEKEA